MALSTPIEQKDEHNQDLIEHCNMTHPKEKLLDTNVLKSSAKSNFPRKWRMMQESLSQNFGWEPIKRKTGHYKFKSYRHRSFTEKWFSPMDYPPPKFIRSQSLKLNMKIAIFKRNKLIKINYITQLMEGKIDKDKKNVNLIHKDKAKVNEMLHNHESKQMVHITKTEKLKAQAEIAMEMNDHAKLRELVSDPEWWKVDNGIAWQVREKLLNESDSEERVDSD